MNWDKHRREDGSIDLIEAHREYNHGVSGNDRKTPSRY